LDLPGWQALHEELEGQGLTIVTVGLEMRGAEVLRPIIEDAAPTHPSLVDTTHQMDHLFGVTNIPQAFWIDESGTIVRGPDNAVPPTVMRPNAEGVMEEYGMGTLVKVDTESYASMLRDWAAKGADSEFVMTPDEVLAKSDPRPLEISEAAAHFAMAQHLHHQEGFTDRVFAHFGNAHRLQPHNITYKRQAYSAYRVSQGAEGDWAMFDQAPHDGEEWPFESNFYADMAALGFDIKLR
jgi:hypothetical protein